MSTIPHWFAKRQGVALGIVSSGTCVGGLILPCIITPLNRTLGVAWSFRIMGLINFATCLTASIFFKDKNPREKKSLGSIVDFSVFRNKNFLIWCLADGLIESGYYVPYFFLPCK
jgi:MFS family permease